MLHFYLQCILDSIINSSDKSIYSTNRTSKQFNIVLYKVKLCAVGRVYIYFDKCNFYGPFKTLYRDVPLRNLCTICRGTISLMQIRTHRTGKENSQTRSIGKQKEYQVRAHAEMRRLNYCARKTIIITRSKLKRHDNAITQQTAYRICVFASRGRKREREGEGERESAFCALAILS